MGIRVDVMSCRGADDRAEYPGGLTLVWGPGGPVSGPFDPDERAPAVAIVRKQFSFGEGLQAMLMEETPGGDSYREVRRAGVGPMFNGRFVWTSDARLGEATGQGACQQPVKLMDRWETAEQYATYD